MESRTPVRLPDELKAGIKKYGADGALYVGFADVGADPSAAVWQIRREVRSAEGEEEITWADGNAEYDNVWNDRETLSYPFSGEVTADPGARNLVIITPDTSNQWPVTAQGRGTDGVVRDLLTTPKGELIVRNADHVIYQRADYTASSSANQVLMGPYPVEGALSASFMASVAMSGGVQLQVSNNGIDWSYVFSTTVALSGLPVNYSAYPGSAVVVTFSVPPCAYVRILSSGVSSITGGRLTLALGRQPKSDFTWAGISGVQQADNQLVVNSSPIYTLSIAGADVQKKSRVLASDSTVNQRRQAAIHSQTGAALNLPFYGDVLTNTITRIATQPYQENQPIAQQANTRGELKIDVDEMRRMQEQQLLAAQAAQMQQLDPNWGFELR